MKSLRDLFLLDPDVVFLNHGSFGATPHVVFEAYQEWQRTLERQPVKFLGRDWLDHLRRARCALGEYLHADADDLAFVPNATTAVNIVARSLALGSGDEVLATNHEYGACDNAWVYNCRRSGARYIHQPIALPVTSDEEMIEQFWQGVTSHTKVIYLSHITSSTALTLPVQAICKRAREAGILSVVDGAHAPGQIDLDLDAIDADIYAGNLHKWLCAPKGSAFLYVRRDKQSLIEPLVLSWGWGDKPAFDAGSPFLSSLEWSGTQDISAYLAVPAAIQFQTEHDWSAVRRACHELVRQALQRACVLTGLATPYADGMGLYQQMAILPLPHINDLLAFKTCLYDEYRVEIPCVEWEQQQFVRISVQGYNTQDDVDALLEALGALLPEVAALSN